MAIISVVYSLLKKIAPTGGWWIGGLIAGSSVPFEFKWKASTPEPMDYTNFDSKQEKALADTLNAQMKKDDGKWKWIDGNAEGYICEEQ